uniref:C-type lectin domain-containing protein n=1 Tax=Kryptolebias marmoratus TaxID=37003 RepID=A0A3Q3G092_KRYMA
MTTGPIGGFWDDKQCSEKYAFVCEKSRPDITPPTKAPTSGSFETLQFVCFLTHSFLSAGWMRFRNKCFMFKGQGHDLKANWSDAQSWCKEQGGELASECGLFASPDFVASYLRDLRFPTWIGLSDQLSENQYAWSDNSPVLYTNWNENEPNNAGGAEHCVAMTHNMLSTGRWNDDACHKNHSFVCYRKKCK